MYEFPKDCVLSELVVHFSEVPYSGRCTGVEERDETDPSQPFVLEFPADGKRSCVSAWVFSLILIRCRIRVKEKSVNLFELI